MAGENNMKAQEAPVIQPILGLLHSRKFLLAVVGLVLDILIAYNPDLLPMREELITAVTLIVGVLIGGITAEDVTEKHAEGKVAIEAERAKVLASATIIPHEPTPQVLG